jgi:hypothetical protein
VKAILASALVLALTGPSLAQGPVVELRIVERHPAPITEVTGTGNNVLNFAVQARVTGATDVGLSQCSFAIVMPGESPSNGTLALNTINNADGSYWAGAISSTSAAQNKVVGVAYAYRYLIGISPSFNGLINHSGGSWTNDPATNSIGLVSLNTLGPGYLLYTDPSGTGLPDTPLDAATELNPWFGANGQWIDIYRFQYTVTNLNTNRTVPVDLIVDNDAVHVFSGSVMYSGMWGPLSAVPAAVNATGTAFTTNVIGACCDNVTAECALSSNALCTAGTFQGVATACTPTPCPGGACCDPATGGCVFRTVLGCAAPQNFSGLGTSCTPNACPQPGTCCDPAGACVFSLQSACAGSSWSEGGACSPNPCPQPGACCTSGGVCSFVLQAECANGSMWNAGVTCAPNPCPGPCCAGTTCTISLENDCYLIIHGQFHAGESCGPAGNPLTCCPANFDGVNGLQVADIFAFLNAWFGGDPRTDFNHDGVHAIGDIFAYLSAWFAGCS